MGAAGVRHLTEKPLELIAFGRRALGVDKLVTYHVAVRSDKADLCIELRFEQVLEKIGRCGLAVGAGYADDSHLRGGITEEVSAQYRQRIAAVFDHDIGNVYLRLSFAYDHRSAVFGRRSDVSVAVKCIARYRNKGVVRLCFARVIAYAAYFSVG